VEELFGAPMNSIMVALLVILLPSIAAVAVIAWRNPVMLKLGLRNIPRRRAQTALIIIGIMISTLIMAAAFGTGDTISYSIRIDAIRALGTIDEIIFSSRASADDNLGSGPYFPYDRFLQLREQVAGLDGIDGLTPGIGEWAPAVNPRTSLSEGNLRIAGVDPGSLAGFGGLLLASGGAARIEDLGRDDVYLNDEAAEELGAVRGDEVRVFVRGEQLSFRVAGVVEKGGLAGPDPALVIPLERAQEIFGREGKINSIAVSNRGGVLAGAKHSEEVTRELRVRLADPQVANSLKHILSRDDVLSALKRWEQNLSGPLLSDVATVRAELAENEVSERLISLLADERVSDEVLDALDDSGIKEVERQAVTLFADLGELRVIDIKQRVLDEADEVGSQVTSFFVIMGLFSIMVGVLLIFLIFVMLAAARRTEMGMARAVGAKRRHLVQMFVFEGSAYAIVSGAVGVLLGLGASALIVVIANRIFAGGGGGAQEDFQMTRHFEIRSAVVAYCLGMIITLATVGVSAYRVSRMNIVAAVRGLPVPITVEAAGWREIVLAPARAAIIPLQLSGRSGSALVALRPLVSLGYLIQAWWAVLGIPIIVIQTLVQVLWRPFRQGWLALVIGVVITFAGTANDEAALFRIGVSLMIVGLGLTIRSILQPTSVRPEVRDRLAYTFMGGLMLAFWVVPFDSLRAVAGEFEGGIEMFFISGIAMVAAAVWTVMYNADLLLRLLTFITRPVAKLRPVLVTAVAYPMSAKLRTGLTLAMFSLVIFTLIVMSILTRTFSTAVADVDTVALGWDIQGTVNFNTPIGDMRQAIADHPDLSPDDFEAIGGYTTVFVYARQPGADNQRWRRYAVRAADDDFLGATGGKLKLIADGFGDTDEAVWQALNRDSSLAIVDSLVVPSRSGFDDDEVQFELEGIYYEDYRMDPIDLEVREPRSGQVVSLKVIGVLDQLTDAFGEIGMGMFVSKRALDEAIPFPIPITTYRFQVAPGVDLSQTAFTIEAAFQEHGMETDVLEELVEDAAATSRAFNYLLTCFMGLGLLVGIAAVGVISLRAVVERRQQIGVQRAIGYRRRMVQMSFLLESSFVVLMGVAIGVGLGTIISYNIVNDIRDDVESIRFSIPWLQIIIIVAVAYFFSLLTTFLPARQASRIYPAEALRYE
jgi:putative ABC transport system permease protein